MTSQNTPRWAPDGWACDDQRNILSPPNLATLSSAFDAPNLVFGFHYWYRGGQGHTNLEGRSPTDILTEIEASRPGDHFTLYSLRHTRGLAEATMELNAASADSLQRLLSLARELSVDTEIVVVLDTSSPRVDVVWRVDDRDVRDLLPTWQAAGPGDAYLFKMGVLDAADDGTIVHSVSPRAGSRRLHALLDAKRPDHDGQTPARGAY